jgi:hypothetical protein
MQKIVARRGFCTSKQNGTRDVGWDEELPLGITMETLTARDLHDLVAVNGEGCISIFMPTHATGREGKQDSIRLKNLIAAAEEQLTKVGMNRSEIQELTEPLSNLPRQDDWSTRKSGLAIFRSKNLMSYYQSALSFEESLVVGRQFYIKPLLPAVRPHLQFFVLAISRNHVRLLKATSDGFETVELLGLPTGMEKALNLQTADRGEQVHSGMCGDFGKEAGVFHGQGGHRDTLKEEFEEYCRLIDESMRPQVRQMPWPVILAGVGYEVALFREVSDCKTIACDALHGTFDYVTDRELYEHALPIARRDFDLKRQAAFMRYRTSVERILTSDDVEEIVSAAYEGKIDTLFVDCSARLFGRYDLEKKSVDITDDRAPEFDLIEGSAVETIRHRGTVYAAMRDELPKKVSMCALLRF